MGPERQPDAAASAPTVAEDTPAADEGDQAVPAPVQAPQQPPPPPPAATGTVPQRLEEEVQRLRIRRDFLRELTCSIPETHQIEDWRGLHLHSSAGPTAARPMIPFILIFCIYLIKPDSKFSTIVHKYVTEPSRIFTLNARMGKRDDFEYGEAEEKFSLKTLL
ncbi:hypothetical protein Tco_1534764 [Tanacetum coccineum]